MSAQGLSLFVEYEGQRRQIKVTKPNATLVQQLLQEACEMFGADPQWYRLKQRKANVPLNNSDPVRFCGLANNATIELVRGSNSNVSNISSNSAAMASPRKGQTVFKRDDDP